jgi:hypothetical protein
MLALGLQKHLLKRNVSGFHGMWLIFPWIIHPNWAINKLIIITKSNDKMNFLQLVLPFSYKYTYPYVHVCIHVINIALCAHIHAHSQQRFKELKRDIKISWRCWQSHNKNFQLKGSSQKEIKLIIHCERRDMNARGMFTNSFVAMTKLSLGYETQRQQLI